MNNSFEVDWDKYAEQYDNITVSGINPAYTALVEVIVNVFDRYAIKANSLVVDLGGGTGNFSIPIAMKNPDSRFVIVDQSEKMLEKAKQKTAEMELKNIEFLRCDAEGLNIITEKYSRPISHVMMIHSLYTMRNIADPEKPQRILKHIHELLESKDSLLVISDVNRHLKSGNWVPYCLWYSYKKYRSLKKTLEFFIENDQSKLANRYIDVKQCDGSYLLCDLNEFEGMIRNAGFSQILERSDKHYRGRDNFIVAKK